MEHLESRVQDENFVVIQGWMIKKLNLSGNNLMIFAVIHGFSQGGNEFVGSQQYLADWSNCTIMSVNRSLKKLIELKYITKGKKKNRYGIYPYTTNYVDGKIVHSQNVSPETNNMLVDDKQNVSPETNKKLDNNIEYSKEDIKKEKIEYGGVSPTEDTSRSDVQDIIKEAKREIARNYQNSINEKIEEKKKEKEKNDFGFFPPFSIHNDETDDEWIF